MNDHPHGEQGSSHAHVTVDHWSKPLDRGARLGVCVDEAVMERLGVRENDLLRVATDRGRSILARVDPPLPGDRGTGIIRLDRLVRGALKAHLNEAVEIEPAIEKPVERIELIPAIDLSLAHDIAPHVQAVVRREETPASIGAVLYINFPNSPAGTTYTINRVVGGPGIASADTEVVLNYHDSHLPEGQFDIGFEDVGGLGKQIKLLRELVQLPLKFPHVYRHLGITAPRGVILYGPPGSGKTHLARAIANEVDARLYYINGPDVIGTYTGETEANLRRIFSEASHHSPSIIFVDELDAMAPKRGETGAHSDTRAVTQMLSLMDGLKRVDSVIVIGTTNRVDAIDQAFRRPGRFDREIFVGPPDAAGRREILEIHTREMPLTDRAQAYLDEVARKTHGFLGADLMELCRDAGLSTLRRSAGDLHDHRAAFRLPQENLFVDKEDFEAALSSVRPSALRETFITIPDVSWDDVGGLAEAKTRLKDTVELPLRNPKLLADAGLPPHVGALLYGPPGAGKTLLAKAVAHECAVNFISVDGPEIFTKWQGESEESIRQIFKVARQVAPAVVFFDQLESIAPIRGAHAGSMTTDRVVSQLLAELDGVEQLSRVIVLAATNRRDLIDPSMLRSGRFGVQIEIGLPDELGRREILEILLRKSFPDDHRQLDKIIGALAPQTQGRSGADLRELCNEAKLAAMKRARYERLERPTLEDFLQALDRRNAR
jgi:transitional endoplasmic reticulum ATPase